MAASFLLLCSSSTPHSALLCPAPCYLGLALLHHPDCFALWLFWGPAHGRHQKEIRKGQGRLWCASPPIPSCFGAALLAAAAFPENHISWPSNASVSGWLALGAALFPFMLSDLGVPAASPGCWPLGASVPLAVPQSCSHLCK